MWEPHVWGFWWVFPVMGVLVFLICLAMASRWAGTGPRCLCMSGDRRIGRDRVADLRREVDDLREQVEQLRAPR